ncbi:tetratricopeptide repeat protein [bacterium]|nr:tetratricopeptide repeat protein [candidate division CSSED10-310 bacterium]
MNAIRRQLLSKAWEISQTGDNQSAISLIESQSPPRHPSENAALAHFSYLLEKYDAAEQYALQALSSDPHHRLALSCLGEIHYRKGDIPTAITYFQEAFRLHSGDDYLGQRLAWMFILDDEPHQAIPVLESVCENNRENYEVLTLLLLSYEYAGLHDKAQHLKTYINQSTTDDESVQTARFIKALNALDTDTAVRQLKIILRSPTFSGNDKLHDFMADLLIRKEHFEDALLHLEKVRQHRPRSDAVKIRIAKCLAKTGKASEAFLEIDNIRHRRKDPRVESIYIEILAQTGKGQEAIDLAVKALLKNPKNRFLRKIMNQLRKEGFKPSDGVLERGS